MLSAAALLVRRRKTALIGMIRKKTEQIYVAEQLAHCCGKNVQCKIKN